MKRLFILPLCLLLLCGCSLREGISTLAWVFSDQPVSVETHEELLELYDLCAQLWDDPAACLDQLAELGWCAVDKNRRCDMVHSEQMEAFLAGEQTSVTFLVLCGDGGFEAVTLENEQISTMRIAGVNGQAQITWENSYSITDMNYTERGWLFLTRDMPDNPTGGNHDGWQEPTLVYRVQPIDHDLRNACTAYIEPIGYGTDGFFLTSWGPEHMDTLDYAGLFPAAYSIFYGRDLIYYESPYPVDASETRARVPADEYERIMLPLLDLTVEQLRSLAGFDGKSYPVFTVRTVSSRYSDVFPDVTALEKNTDGTWTLTVNGISPSLRTDCAFTHRITLRPTESGTVYLSNQVLALH